MIEKIEKCTEILYKTNNQLETQLITVDALLTASKQLDESCYKHLMHHFLDNQFIVIQDIQNTLNDVCETLDTLKDELKGVLKMKKQKTLIFEETDTTLLMNEVENTLNCYENIKNLVTSLSTVYDAKTEQLVYNVFATFEHEE